MDLPFKKKGNNKEAWLDWLSDDAPSQDAQAELRSRYVQRANTYQPREFTPQSAAPVPPSAPSQPAQPTQSQPTQAQAVRPAEQSTAAPAASQSRPASPAGSGVSIQINIPQLQLHKLRRLRNRLNGYVTTVKSWFMTQWQQNRPRTIALSVIAVLFVAGLLARPVLHSGNNGAGTGANSGAAAPKHAKPTFKVVIPSNKPKLATPDGVHAAYDGTKNNYSYSDSIGQYGFIVSEQPIPTKFNTAEDAINTIGPQIYGATAGHTVSTSFGDAYVTTSGKGSQSVVFSVHNLLMFIQSSHKFSDTAITDYINLLQ